MAVRNRDTQDTASQGETFVHWGHGDELEASNTALYQGECVCHARGMSLPIDSLECCVLSVFAPAWFLPPLSFFLGVYPSCKVKQNEGKSLSASYKHGPPAVHLSKSIIPVFLSFPLNAVASVAVMHIDGQAAGDDDIPVGCIPRLVGPDVH